MRVPFSWYSSWNRHRGSVSHPSYSQDWCIWVQFLKMAVVKYPDWWKPEWRHFAAAQPRRGGERGNCSGWPQINEACTYQRWCLAEPPYSVSDGLFRLPFRREQIRLTCFPELCKVCEFRLKTIWLTASEALTSDFDSSLPEMGQMLASFWSAENSVTDLYR